MISVCIPVYNYNVTELVMQLHSQLKRIDVPIEIIVIDDASLLKWKNVNAPISEFVNAYIELDQNVGRSAIRNLFLQHCKFSKLIFLDCDGLLISEHFLMNYYQAISNTPSVVVGGREYGDKPNDLTKILRWTYGKLRESRPVSERLKNPYESFMTNNFMIDKGLLSRIKFDETLIRYGHEDTLFGFELGKKSIPIIHIDNPVMNIDLETASEYLSKTKQGIINLYNISTSLNHDKHFIQSIKLLKYWKKTKGFSGVISRTYKLFSRSIESNLLGEKPRLRYFDFYKLNELIRVEREDLDSHVI